MFGKFPVQHMFRQCFDLVSMKVIDRGNAMVLQASKDGSMHWCTAKSQHVPQPNDVHLQLMVESFH